MGMTHLPFMLLYKGKFVIMILTGDLTTHNSLSTQHIDNLWPDMHGYAQIPVSIKQVIIYLCTQYANYRVQYFFQIIFETARSKP